LNTGSKVNVNNDLIGFSHSHVEFSVVSYGV